MSKFQMYSLMYSRSFTRTNKTGIGRTFETRDSKRRTFESENEREIKYEDEKIGERERERERSFESVSIK